MQLLAPLGLRAPVLFAKARFGRQHGSTQVSTLQSRRMRCAVPRPYRVVVEPQSGGDAVWDSGRVNSSESHLIECGTDLKSASAYRWRAMWWATDCGSCAHRGLTTCRLKPGYGLVPTGPARLARQPLAMVLRLRFGAKHRRPGRYIAAPVSRRPLQRGRH